jgi:hypothetical protein
MGDVKVLSVIWREILKYSSGILIIFLLVTYKANFQIALLYTLCLIVGYLNVFYIVHTLVKKSKIDIRKILVFILVLLADMILVYFGFGLIIGFVTVCSLILYSIVLKYS